MTPFASVAMLEKLALLKIAFCKAPVFSRVSSRRTSVTISTARGSPSRMVVCIFVPFLICDWPCLEFSLATVGARKQRGQKVFPRRRFFEKSIHAPHGLLRPRFRLLNAHAVAGRVRVLVLLYFAFTTSHALT